MEEFTEEFTIVKTLEETASDDARVGRIIRKGVTSPAYPEALITHWAEAVVNGPVRNISRYDEAAKLLATLAAPVQVGLFALYDKVGNILDTTRPWLLILACAFPIASVFGVVYYVVKVCDERLKLIIDFSASHGLEQKDLADGEKEGTRILSRLPRWRKHVWRKPACKSQETGILSYLLDGPAEGCAPSAKMATAVKKWEEHVEFVASCKHQYLVYAAYCFVAGALTPLLMLVILAAVKWWTGGPQ